MAANKADFTTQNLLFTEDPTASIPTFSINGTTTSREDVLAFGNFQYVNITVRLLMGLLAINCNLLTVVAIARYEYLRSCTNYLIVALAIGDMIGGFNCLAVPINYLTPMTNTTWLNACATEIILNMVSVGLNLSYILLISVDRFIFITFPLRYYSLVIPRLVAGAIVLPFVLVMLHTLAIHLTVDEFEQPRGRICRGVYPKHVNFSLNLWFYIITPLTVMLYIRIAWIAYQQSRTIEQTQNVATNSQLKITKMLSLVLGVYLACYMPQMIILVIKNYLAPDNFIILDRVASWIWWINSWANPFIYAWKNKDFNRAFRCLLRLNIPTVEPVSNLTTS